MFSSPCSLLRCLTLKARFVGILFVDALQRMFRTTAESDLAKSGNGGVLPDVRTDSNLAAKRF